MQPTSTASFSPDDLLLVLYKHTDGTTHRVVLQPLDAKSEVYARLTADLAPTTMVAIDRGGRAFRLGSFDGNGVDAGQDRPPPELP